MENSVDVKSMAVNKDTSQHQRLLMRQLNGRQQANPRTNDATTSLCDYTHKSPSVDTRITKSATRGNR